MPARRRRYTAPEPAPADPWSQQKVRLFAFAGLAVITTVLWLDSAVAQDALKQSMEYVGRLDDGCTYTDGYRCADIEEDSFLHADSVQRMVPARYLLAWQSAYADFVRIDDLTAEQKDLRHYRVGFTEDEHHYIVLLNGLLLPWIGPDGRPQGVTQAVYGRSTKYWVDKRTLVVVKRLYMR